MKCAASSQNTCGSHHHSLRVVAKSYLHVPHLTPMVRHRLVPRPPRSPAPLPQGGCEAVPACSSPDLTYSAFSVETHALPCTASGSSPRGLQQEELYQRITWHHVQQHDVRKCVVSSCQTRVFFYPTSTPQRVVDLHRTRRTICLCSASVSRHQNTQTSQLGSRRAARCVDSR